MIEQIFQGYKICVGENQKENDVLLRTSDLDDIWVHISGRPSAHAVVSNPSGKKIPRKVIKRACCIVKQYSSSKSEKNLVFDMTRIRYIILTNVPGLVSISNESKITI